MTASAGTVANSAQRPLRDMALVAGAGVVFSFGSILFRAVDDDVGAWQFLFWRAASAAAAMGLWLAVTHGRSAIGVVRRAGRGELLAALALGSAFSLFIVALTRVDVALILFLQAGAPFVAGIFGWLLLREVVAPRTMIAMVIAVAGIAIMVGTGLGERDAFGVVLSLALVFAIGLFSVALRGAPDADPAVTPLLATVGVATLALIVTTATGDGVWFGLTDVALACVAGGVLLGLGLPMYTGGHRTIPAAEVPLLLLTEIILAPLWVWIWPGERPSAGTLLGGAVLLGAVIWLALGERRDARDAAATVQP